MGRRDKKNAKGRLDHFYWLAKEQGYRSRAAFKLVQLNKKYNFLEHARCCIDLCAAPGGWLQVASKYMPNNSLIVGVDLVPIKPIPRCITFAEDINSYKCRDQLRNELKDWKADIVLHDGAPNVGTAWVQDAYTQSELTLQSLKLAVEFLAPGGTFVTKVFRSKDYNSLLWVFNQLFKTVEATKPASSRNVSAEIFVVCVGFKAPARIDPKFLDPQHVFKDLEPGKVTSISGDADDDDDDADSKKPLEADKIVAAAGAHAHATANVFQPEKKRRKRDGYMEGETLFKSASLHDFLRTQDPVAILGVFNEIALKLPKDASDEDKQDLEKALKHEDTTEDIRINCSDLRVLGKKDFRRLLKWRIALRIELGLEKVADTVEITEHEEPEEELDEEAQIDEELVRLNEEAARRARKERRRRNEAKARTIQKLQLSMTTPMDIGADLADEAVRGGEEEIFGLNHVDDEGRFSKRHGRTSRPNADNLIDVDGEQDSESESDGGVDQDEDEEILDSDEEREAKLLSLEGDVDDMYERYREHLQQRDAKFRAREARSKSAHREKWEGIKENHDSDSEVEDMVSKPRTGANDDDEEEAESEGGYDIVERRKMMEETYDSDDAEDDAEDAEYAAASQTPSVAPKKRKRSLQDDQPKTAVPAKTRKVHGSQASAVSTAPQSREAAIWFDNPLFKSLPGLDSDEEEDASDEDGEDGDGGDSDESDAEELDSAEESEEEEEDVDQEADSGEEVEVEENSAAEDDFEIVPQDDDALGHRNWDFDDEDIDAKKRAYIEKHGLTTAEAVTLAQQLVNRQTTKAGLIDSGFTKHNFVDKDGLPTWFLDDESKHYKANVPITKEAVQALRAKQKALDARPIKKIAEAKARKKFKAAQRLAKAQAKAESMNDTEDISEKEKAQNISKVLAKGAKKPEKKEVKLIVAKGTNRGLKGRPKGIKGRYKMVDPRMKKEIRAQKRIDKRDGKKRSSSHSQRKPRIPNGY
ncbi:AdoMet-dependent rRNA methyltransferase spb1 [Tilletia horrida]|uniref:AdoMet-dependent rRNA methyltransferase spb1 n=1 Tax=Tilletia horrida TaxID=155126 RepID=A0AAN6GLT6_9BASI|nr:AdoMet-dependent rRNA methyltransferase spb1 [Tilletia horrida]KAK0550418.1 AdoMet-dependent rRNA methyltransferase spb1 [Tilletia horrida]KAK0562845.1 AdoMet-dependent rRNA methyltransferase spb1 [Tilletia horrida]